MAGNKINNKNRDAVIRLRTVASENIPTMADTADAGWVGLRHSTITVDHTPNSAVNTNNRGSMRKGRTNLFHSTQCDVEMMYESNPDETTAGEQLDALLKTGFDIVAAGNSTVQAAPGPSTTAIELGAIGTLRVGGCCIVESTTTAVEVKWVSAVATNLVTLGNPLALAPVSTDVVRWGVSYDLMDDMGVGDQDSCSVMVWDKSTLKMECAVDFVWDTMTVNINADGLGFAYSGPAYTKAFAGKTTLDGAISNSVTTIPFENSGGIGPLTMLEINGVEEVRTPDFDAADFDLGTANEILNCTRNYDSVGAATGSDGDVVIPAVPTATYQTTTATIPLKACKLYYNNAGDPTHQEGLLEWIDATIVINRSVDKIANAGTHSDMDAYGTSEAWTGTVTVTGIETVNDDNTSFDRFEGMSLQQQPMHGFFQCGKPKTAGGGDGMGIYFSGTCNKYNPAPWNSGKREVTMVVEIELVADTQANMLVISQY